MKTLNDYIKESILDDEEELIDRASKDANNPFLTLKNLLIENFKDKKNHTKEVERLIQKPILDVIKKYPPLKNIKFRKHLSFSHSTNNKYVGYYYYSDNGEYGFLDITYSTESNKLYIGINSTMSKYNYDLKLYDLWDKINSTLIQDYGFKKSNFNKYVVEI